MIILFLIFYLHLNAFIFSIRRLPTRRELSSLQTEGHLQLKNSNAEWKEERTLIATDLGGGELKRKQTVLLPLEFVPASGRTYVRKQILRSVEDRRVSSHGIAGNVIQQTGGVCNFSIKSHNLRLYRLILSKNWAPHHQHTGCLKQQ